LRGSHRLGGGGKAGGGDGPGYPESLCGCFKFTLVITIADIFGALIEHRPYHPPNPGRAAFEVLRGMTISSATAPCALSFALVIWQARIRENVRFWHFPDSRRVPPHGGYPG
jgi:hypothetical protein